MPSKPGTSCTSWNCLPGREARAPSIRMTPGPTRIGRVLHAGWLALFAMGSATPHAGENQAGAAPFRARVITVSDRCSRKEAEDVSGPLAADLLTEFGVTSDVVVVPDGAESVREAIGAAARDGVQIVFTTGGTGLSPRDQTPEATEPLLTMRIDGLAEAIRRRGSAHVPAAVLSRGMAGVIGTGDSAVLVVNAPGSPGGVRDAVAVLGPLVSHVLEQLAGQDHQHQA